MIKKLIFAIIIAIIISITLILGAFIHLKENRYLDGQHTLMGCQSHISSYNRHFLTVEKQLASIKGPVKDLVSYKYTYIGWGSEIRYLLLINKGEQFYIITVNDSEILNSRMINAKLFHHYKNLLPLNQIDQGDYKSYKSGFHPTCEFMIIYNSEKKANISLAYSVYKNKKGMTVDLHDGFQKIFDREYFPYQNSYELNPQNYIFEEAKWYDPFIIYYYEATILFELELQRKFQLEKNMFAELEDFIGQE